MTILVVPNFRPYGREMKKPNEFIEGRDYTIQKTGLAPPHAPWKWTSFGIGEIRIGWAPTITLSRVKAREALEELYRATHRANA